MHRIDNIIGNYFNKHETKNFLYKFIVNRYKNKFKEILRTLSFDSIMEIGSGEGYIILYTLQVKKPKLIVASDISMRYFHSTLDCYRLVCKGENIPFPNHMFDLVVACEVLEHIYTPVEVVREMTRISKNWVLITVPYEPYWRLLNIMRGKYINNLGNTPGHVSHFTKNSILKLLSGYLTPVKIMIVFPWIFILGQVKVKS